ncbi:MAG TPA: hypothetical protein VFJ17_13325 [Mycobacteriales bacterium]|jgi:hypothetical protein|nr:hypothetical protein [Mycobacteriales bacterium]
MSDALPVIEAHLAAGDAWSLSRARDAATGAARLLITVADADPVTLRRDLAVAGSIGGAHLAEVVDAVARSDGSVAVVVVPPGGPSLAQLVGRRGALSAAELVSLLAPLAATLGSLHARGLSLGAVVAETVWLESNGRPVLMPIGCGARGDVGGDLVALATMGMSVLDRSSPDAASVATALRAAADGRQDAAGLANALLRATTAAPIAATAGAPRARRAERRSRSRFRAPRLRLRLRQARPVVAIVAVALVAIAAGALSGGNDGGGTVLAAPPVAEVRSPAVAAPSWRSVMSQLVQTRARAYATADAALLDDVYATGSPEGAADRRLLSRLMARGRRAVGLRAFVEGVTVITATDTHVDLLMTDALTAYDVLGRHGRVIRHGQGRPSGRRRVRLVRTAAGWRIWSVRPVGPQH